MQNNKRNRTVIIIVLCSLLALFIIFWLHLLSGHAYFLQLVLRRDDEQSPFGELKHHFLFSSSSGTSKRNAAAAGVDSEGNPIQPIDWDKIAFSPNSVEQFGTSNAARSSAAAATTRTLNLGSARSAVKVRDIPMVLHNSHFFGDGDTKHKPFVQTTLHLAQDFFSDVFAVNVKRRLFDLWLGTVFVDGANVKQKMQQLSSRRGAILHSWSSPLLTNEKKKQNGHAKSSSSSSEWLFATNNDGEHFTAAVQRSLDRVQQRRMFALDSREYRPQDFAFTRWELVRSMAAQQRQQLFDPNTDLFLHLKRFADNHQFRHAVCDVLGVDCPTGFPEAAIVARFSVWLLEPTDFATAHSEAGSVVADATFLMFQNNNKRGATLASEEYMCFDTNRYCITLSTADLDNSLVVSRVYPHVALRRTLPLLPWESRDDAHLAGSLPLRVGFSVVFLMPGESVFH